MTLEELVRELWDLAVKNSQVDDAEAERYARRLTACRTSEEREGVLHSIRRELGWHLQNARVAHDLQQAAEFFHKGGDLWELIEQCEARTAAWWLPAGAAVG